ncbi:MAG: hypothetical protein A2V84_03735 [Chloroflexi bacterium RBG_16_70_13]|nr:MAG: hypothetical protein A2V84_03735 [Chloroflexi bacterium RBG_16_70_13]
MEAVADRRDLRGRTDLGIVERAAAERRTIVTADVVDHLGLFRDRQRLGARHPGLVLLAPGRWRLSTVEIGALVRALAALLSAEAGMDGPADRVVWLERPA